MRKALMSLVLLSGVAAAPLAAQSVPATPSIDSRVGKLEKEMKAVQRKVFPAGVPLQPDITPAAAPNTAAPSTTPLADLTARVDALETQLQNLTGQVETNSSRIRRLEDGYKALAAAIEARLRALEPQSAQAPTGLVETPAPTPVDVIETNASTAAATMPQIPAQAAAPVEAAPPPPAPAPQPVVTQSVPVIAPAQPVSTSSANTMSPERRKALINAIEIPATGNPTEDSYSYAFRLWQGGFYPEAQAKLKEFVAKNPRNWRTSYAQNLLGRAYLDEGKPALASVAFYDNYTKNPRGMRAQESLYYLGVALTRLKKLPDACKVYDEFRDVYGSSASADLQAKVAKGRVDAKCG